MVINLLSLAPSWGLPSQHFSMLLVRSYRTLAPLPYIKVLGGMFLWHYPHGYPHWELPSKPDHMGARTFLKKVLFCFQNKTFLRLPLLLSSSIVLITPKSIYWGCSSAGQSNGFLNRRSWVRLPPVPLKLINYMQYVCNFATLQLVCNQ